MPQPLNLKSMPQPFKLKSLPQPLNLKSINCERLNFYTGIKKGALDFARLLSNLASANPKLKRSKKPPIFVSIDSANPEADSHLHLTVEKSKDFWNLELSILPLSRPSVARDFTVTIENVNSWLGDSIAGELTGHANASFFYKGTQFKTVIPLPYSSVLPIDSAIIRKSSIAGLDVEVAESDIGLKRFFVYKLGEDTISLSFIFTFSHLVNYSFFLKLVEKAKTISSVLVLEQGRDRT